MFRAKPDSFPCCHSVLMITSGASSAGISDECRPCRKGCLLPAVRQMGAVVAWAHSALFHSNTKWWELQAQRRAEHCTVLHSPSFCCSCCHHACLFLFQFGWKFPPEIVLVIFYPNSHNSCFSFGFQGTPFSCSFLCPRFQTILSPCSPLSVPCLPSGSVLPLPTPSSCPLVALQSNREGWKPRGALCPHLVSPQLHRMASGQTKCTCGLFG